jgi:hypothetical protein
MGLRFVIPPAFGISPHDEKIFWAREPPMTHAGGVDENIPGHHLNYPPLSAPDTQARVTTSYA